MFGWLEVWAQWCGTDGDQLETSQQTAAHPLVHLPAVALFVTLALLPRAHRTTWGFLSVSYVEAVVGLKPFDPSGGWLWRDACHLRDE